MHRLERQLPAPKGSFYYFSAHYEALVMRSAIEFLDRLSVEELRAAMAQRDIGVGVILVTVPETLKYLVKAEGI
ncbi:MAG: B3 domain-containing protein [Gammaproteobacteria bacterium]|nr:B3 domain-containing protein [Gammaproteobacteria bacterium]